MMWRGSRAAHSKATAVVVVTADNVSGLRFALQRPNDCASFDRTRRPSTSTQFVTLFRPLTKSHDEEPEDRGFLSIIPGRCFVFPSLLNYRIELPQSGSGLVDPAKPGRIQLVMFHLVDPERRVRSSAVLPPLQPNWILDAFLGPVAWTFSLPWAVQALIGEFLNIGVNADDPPNPANPSQKAKKKQHLATMTFRDRRTVVADPPYRRTIVEKKLLQATVAARLERPQDERLWMTSTLHDILNVLCLRAIQHVKSELPLDVQPPKSPAEATDLDAVTRKLSMLKIRTEKQDRYWLLARLCVWAEIVATDEEFDITNKKTLKRTLRELFELVSPRALDRMVALLLSLLDMESDDREQVSTLLTDSGMEFRETVVVYAALGIKRDLKMLERWLQRRWSADFSDVELSETVISDSTVSSDLRAQYLDHVARLRPTGEDSSVVFLIDPSLYPLVPLATVPRLVPSLVAHGLVESATTIAEPARG
ncbi:hypothetical protein PINS_up020938 [Pythium insidiosum]|nr:hypothetical protein PINS_up020938 [Pythium insidiosum]